MNSDIPHGASATSLDLFHKPRMLVNFESGNVQEIHLVTSLDGPNLEFNIETDRHLYVDLQNIYLKVGVKILKGNNQDIEYNGNKDEVSFANNVLHSLFPNCEVFFNNELIYTANGLYAHKSLIETEISHSLGVRNRFCIARDIHMNRIQDRLQVTYLQKGKNSRRSLPFYIYLGNYQLIFSTVSDM